MISIEGIFERIGLHHPDTTGVAFSGGGAKGLSHIGVIMAMEKFGINPHVISGVSAGAIAAVMYGAGLSPLDIRQCFVDYNKFADFREWSLPKDGIFKLDKFAKILESWLPVRNLEELKIPTVVCATNLEKGAQVGWGKGEIAPRVLASCSIPVVFKPVKIGDYHFVDGGVIHNLPAWAIRDYCDRLIGCNCSPLDPYKYKNSILDIALRTYQLGFKANTLQDAKLCDTLVVVRDLTKQKTFDLSSIDYCIKLGYETACRVFEKDLNSKSRT